MRSRAAILPHPADPYLFNYWLKFYRTIWQDEVDHLYIFINSPMEYEVIKFMLDLVKDDPKITCDYIGSQLEHGTAIREMLEKCTESHVMLIEDDGFIFKPGAVERSFRLIEDNATDIVASPRGSCSDFIWNEAKKKWNLDYSREGDTGPNFWPCYFFSAKMHLLNTDRNFNARAWQGNELIEPLEAMAPELTVGDTFVNTSLQLRAKGLRIIEVPQYHASPNDLDHFRFKTNLFDGIAPWTHIGSLSSGTHGVLMDDEGRPLARRKIDPPKEAKLGDYCNTSGERLEWERRVTMWSMFYDESPADKIEDFRKEYKKAIDRIIAQYGLDRNKIEKWKTIYRSIGL